MHDLRDRAPARTVAWLPGFFTGEIPGKIANLVRIDYLLTGSRLDEAASHLGADDRARAGSATPAWPRCASTCVATAIARGVKKI